MDYVPAWPDSAELERSVERGGQPRTIGEVIAELLAQYQARFPEVDTTALGIPALDVTVAA